jgi:hypothetical protein
MYLVLIAWIYVALMMAVAEATSPVGSLLGAVFTFLLYGLLPMGVVGYIMGSPARRRAIKAKQAAERAQLQTENGIQPADDAHASVAPDAHREPSGDPIATVRKEP